MSKQADKKLLQAVLEPRLAGSIEAIPEACAAGADPNAIVPETSTSMGYVRGGSTLLNHAIHEESSRAVEKLLESGADPNLADPNGWTPWMASTLADDKQERIQALLQQYGASREGEHIGQLIRAIGEGDVDRARSLLQSDHDLHIVATFRVDLVRHQVINGNVQMLAFLLDNGMQANSSHLTSAIRARNAEAVDLLLHHGVPPEDPGDSETPLMMAAGIGDLRIVQRLVEGGADVNRCADDNVEWTAAFCAREAGHTKVAEWLTAQMDRSLLEEQEQLMEARDPRFRALYEHATGAEALSTDDIVAVLAHWNERYGIEVMDASGDSVDLEFGKVPADMDAFIRELSEFCPDIMEDSDAIARALRENRTVTLWWD